MAANNMVASVEESRKHGCSEETLEAGDFKRFKMDDAIPAGIQSEMTEHSNDTGKMELDNPVGIETPNTAAALMKPSNGLPQHIEIIGTQLVAERNIASPVVSDGQSISAAVADTSEPGHGIEQHSVAKAVLRSTVAAQAIFEDIHNALEAGDPALAPAEVKIQINDEVVAHDSFTAALPDSATKPETAGSDVSSNELAIVQAHDTNVAPRHTLSTALKPKVWAEVKQDLCAALPSFKAYQGGTYFSDGYVKGQLFDSQCRARDIIGAEVVISTCPGTREKLADGHMAVRKESTKWTTRTVGLFTKTMKDRKPVYLILGSQHHFFPEPNLQNEPDFPYLATKAASPAPHRYMAMGWFLITDIHQEKWRTHPDDDLASSWVIRWEKMKGPGIQEVSWWYPADLTMNDRTGYAKPGEATSVVKSCSKCNTSSQQVFEQAWTCLKTDCLKYFTFEDSSIDKDKLKYSTSWLRERASQDNVSPPGPLAPPLPKATYNGINEFGTEVEFRQGMVCPSCGSCADRVRWDGWECPNPTCRYLHAASVLSFPLEKIKVENLALLQKRTRLMPKDSDLKVFEYRLAGHKAITYLLPAGDGSGDIVGTLTHLKSNSNINSRPNGPDYLFQKTEQQAKIMKRWVVSAAGHARQLRCRHFTLNWGATYKYSVREQSSKPFSDADDEVIVAMMRMIWAGEAFTGKCKGLLEGEKLHKDCPSFTAGFQQPNELLQVGYMEKDAMGYHDDGEHDVGHTVVTLSLGSPATMSFMLKRKKKPYHTAATSSRASSSGSKPVPRPRAAEQTAVKLQLFHGDMVLMHGSAIHGHYLHKVDPHGKRRFALTTRYIDPHRIKDETQRDISIQAGTLPEDARKFEYDGF